MTDALTDKVARHLAALGTDYRLFPCDPADSGVEGLVNRYGFRRDRIVNCIIVVGDRRHYAACVVLATCKIDVNKVVCQLLGTKRATFASPDDVSHRTGMIVGGIAPFGLPSQWPIFIDKRVMEVMEEDELVLGAGGLSSKIVLHPREFLRIRNGIVVQGLGFER